MKTEKNKTVVEVGKVYEIEDQRYLIDEIGFNKVYGFQVDDNNKPYGRRRIVGSLKKKEIRLVG
jgi:hypothetical protein